MKDMAYNYWKQGHAVVTFKITEENKKPLVEWKSWIQGEQTEEQFNTQPWDRANAFGVICGRKLKNGLYVAAVDFDVKNVSEEALAKGKKVLATYSVTQREKTPSGGEHLIFYSHEPVKSTKAFHDTYGLELLGEGSIVIMSPSKGYSRLNDNTPTEKADLTAYFFELLGEEKPEAAWFKREDLKGKKYRGGNPPCINTLLRGTNEGLRNEYGIRLASYLLNFRMYQPQSVLKIMKKWNKLNTPVLPNIEVDNIVKSAIQKNYVYGCSDPILQDLCKKEECPMAPKTVVLTKEQRDEAEKLLENLDLLQVVLTYGRKKLIGEDMILLQNFIEICSGQTLYPVSGMLCGFSGSGKNESIRAIKPLMPSEWLYEFTISTPEAVKYIPEDFHGTLIIYEASGMQSKTATLSLRAVGEAESIETIYPMRDEATGKMTLARHRTNAKNFITTVSNVDIQADLFRRVLKSSMNHSKVLTRRVLAKEVRTARVPESLMKILKKEEEPSCTMQEFQNALRVQDWKAEVIVFVSPGLLGLLDYAATKEQQVALRTQFKKILYFIRVLALLRQKNRVHFNIGDSKYVFANPQDYRNALKILESTILETISRIGKRQQEVFDLFEREESLDKHKVAKKLKVSTTTAARALKALYGHGYLSENKNVKPYSYEVLREKAKPFVIFKNTNEYDLFYRKELKFYLNSILSPSHSPVPNRKMRINVTGLEGTLKFSGTPDVVSRKVSSEQGLNVSFENKEVPLVFSEMTNEQNLFPCPLCAAYGKQVFFSSEHDLHLHIEKTHDNKPKYVT